MSADPRNHSFRQACLDALGKGRPALVAGGGFCLAFGWAWFAGIQARVLAALPKVFSGAFLSGGGISVFCVALAAGFVMNGCLARRAAARPGRRTPLLLHGEALVCLLGGLFAREAAPSAAAALFGLAASGPGVFWTARMLRLPPPRAGMALVAAAVLAYILHPAFLAFDAAVLLPLGTVLALCLSLAEPTPAPTSRPQRIEGSEQAHLRPILPLVALPLSFFALGITASAVRAPASIGLLPSAAGMAVAAACCLRLRAGAPGASLLAVGAVAAAALQLAVFPGLIRIPPFLWGIAEGAAFIGVAALPNGDETENRPVDFRRAGFYLAAVLALVNLGGAAGAMVTRSGDTGGWLFGLVCVALCPPILLALAKYWKPLGERGALPTAPPAAIPQEAAKSHASPSPLPAPPSPPPTLWPGLTNREQTIAELLIRDMTNPEICASLFVSENTVRTHIKNLYHKTGATSREELKRLLRSNARNAE